MDSCTSKLINTEKVSDGLFNVFYANGVQIGELVIDVDGFWYFWPMKEKYGSWSEGALRAVADELHKMNEAWENQIQEHFENIGSE